MGWDSLSDVKAGAALLVNGYIPVALSNSEGAGSVRTVVWLPGAHLYEQVLGNASPKRLRAGPPPFSLIMGLTLVQGLLSPGVALMPECLNGLMPDCQCWRAERPPRRPPGTISACPSTRRTDIG